MNPEKNKCAFNFASSFKKILSNYYENYVDLF